MSRRSEVEELAHRFGLSEEARDAFGELVQRTAEGPPPRNSILDTLPDGTGVSLTAGPGTTLSDESGWNDTTDEITRVPASGTLDRYDDPGLIGTGGMGEVRRVRDRDLNRTMAMKIVRPELLAKPETLARFIEEAQATAQLQHPGIVPVHELGRLFDGRLYFTMQVEP